MKLNIFQADAFTQKVFGGNPAAVCPLESWLDDELLQQIAVENNLSETAYFVPKGDHYELRWFTPALEVDLCGHATLAAAHVIFEHLGYTKDTIDFHSRSGLLQVKKHEKGYAMDFPARIPELVPNPSKALFKALNTTSREVRRTKDYMLIHFENEAEIKEMKPNFGLLNTVDALGFIITAPGDTVDFVSRFFAPRAGINEDPVTGSAHCDLVPFWAEKMKQNHFHALQISERGGELFCEYSGDRVILIGQAVTYLEGIIVV